QRAIAPVDKPGTGAVGTVSSGFATGLAVLGGVLVGIIAGTGLHIAKAPQGVGHIKADTTVAAAVGTPQGFVGGDGQMVPLIPARMPGHTTAVTVTDRSFF